VKPNVFFRIVNLAVAAHIGVLGLGLSSADAAQSTKKTTTKKAAPARRQPARQTAARQRAAATAREMADTAVPRYKVDASGELVPDVHAAAAIIYNPDTNQVLFEVSDDRGGFSRGQPRPQSPGDDRSPRRLPRVDDVSARQRQGHD
jgi:hypothetical protein